MARLHQHSATPACRRRAKADITVRISTLPLASAHRPADFDNTSFTGNHSDDRCDCQSDNDRFFISPDSCVKTAQNKIDVAGYRPVNQPRFSSSNCGQPVRNRTVSCRHFKTPALPSKAWVCKTGARIISVAAGISGQPILSDGATDDNLFMGPN